MTFASGKEVVADLVVRACDGVNSVIRNQMIGDTHTIYLHMASIPVSAQQAPSIPTWLPAPSWRWERLKSVHAEGS